MKVGDLVCLTDEFYDSYLSKDIPQQSGIVVKKYAWYETPFEFTDEPSIDGFQYDAAFGSKLIQGLLWGWEVMEVRESESGRSD